MEIPTQMEIPFPTMRVADVMREWWRWAWLQGWLERAKQQADRAGSRRRDGSENGGGFR